MSGREPELHTVLHWKRRRRRSSSLSIPAGPLVGAASQGACPGQVAIEELAAKLEESQRGAIAIAGETEEQRNKFLVLRLYEALNTRDHAAVQSLLAPDLEWWFHGPPKHQHMMRILTGGAVNNNNTSSSSSSFRFVPRSVEAFGSTVIAEGPPPPAEGKVYWVHAWTVGPDGVITQLREYFNTDLTVTRLAAAKCVWQSHRPDSATNSLPGLVLAI
ncbi:uncharacterized protein LOC133892936 [Phragmites australis]|uniref:uncharacterized protein LOC133892936 n=1 Tax=Phragmites australis TaxID=29695 RepID=UPI002D76C291|nr:uncharacterized protein LOC133892936 [Phragmites australis]